MSDNLIIRWMVVSAVLLTLYGWPMPGALGLLFAFVIGVYGCFGDIRRLASWRRCRARTIVHD